MSERESVREPCEVDLGSVEQFQHTADVGIVARGSDISQLFSLCARGLIEIIVGGNTASFGRTADTDDIERESRRAECQGQDAETLMVEFLTEILYLLETEGLLVISTVPAVHPTGKRLEAELVCLHYHEETMGHLTEVKAVTYHMILVDECIGGGWGARLVFDL